MKRRENEVLQNEVTMYGHEQREPKRNSNAGGGCGNSGSKSDNIGYGTQESNATGGNSYDYPH